MTLVVVEDVLAEASIGIGAAVLVIRDLCAHLRKVMTPCDAPTLVAAQGAAI